MVEESERMIEDTKKRLGAAVHELRDIIVGFSLRFPHRPPILNILFAVSTTGPVQS